MRIKDKLKELGYKKSAITEFWYKDFNDTVRQYIVVDKNWEIADAMVAAGFIKSQQRIDDVQIAFNKLQEDLKKLQESGLVIEED